MEEDLLTYFDPVTEIAVKYFGINYLFPYQRLVISNILEAADAISSEQDTSKPAPEIVRDDIVDSTSKQIVILPTGAGKSLCFMLPTVIIDGPTLVIFPLLSLISDQLRRCKEAGIEAAGLTGGQKQVEREQIFSAIANGSIKIILTNPETALSPQVLPRIKECRFIHLVFDEVHTVSEWGDTFRPAYLESRRIYAEAGIPIVTAFTATASEMVLNRVEEVLFPGESPHIVSANPDRPNISYTVLPSLCKTNSLQLLLNRADSADRETPYPAAELVQRPALIFCSTRRTAERTALQLRMRLNETEIYFYHAGLERDEKADIEKWFHGTKSGILTATIAFGMGMDVSGIRTVIHHDLSPSVEAYLQESGRAGRDREPAEAILLLSPSDTAADGLHRGTAAAVKRQDALLKFATDSSTCRRESLMRLLGTEPDTCFGCDVCRNTLELTAPWEKEVLGLMKHNRRVLSKAGLNRMLKGRYPSLSEADTQVIITELIISGRLKIIRRGPWKGKLTN